MITPATTLATEADFDRSISSLVAAFIADPFIRWMLPDAKQYLHTFPQVLKYFAGGAFAHGSAWRSADYRASAMWLPPGIEPDNEALGRVMEQGVDSELISEVFEVMQQVDASHPQEDHWYLPAIGVEPMLQGKGYGSALLVSGLKRCDDEHVAAYLEATNPANIPLYERFGFRVIGAIQAGSSPTITPMFRPAR
jgi:ribosomal protein S18 acetylase RimI-like enzyme